MIYNREELNLGIKIEYEHKDLFDFLSGYLEKNKIEMPITLEEFASWITKAHLREIPDYNTRLIAMEKQAKSNKKRPMLPKS